MLRALAPCLVALLFAGAAHPAGAGDITRLLHGPQCKPHHRGPKTDASWARPRKMTVVTDSVLLGGGPALRAKKPCWHVDMVGREFMNMPQATERLKKRRRVAPVAVIGLGYNSNWQRDRENYAFWAKKFDADAKRLLRTMRARGTKQFVWVTVRQPTKRVTPRKAWGELPMAWYLRYVNERLRHLDRQRDDLTLADWNTASKKPGLTYDAIHLNPRGAKLMVNTIRTAILAESRRQTAAN